MALNAETATALGFTSPPPMYCAQTRLSSSRGPTAAIGTFSDMTIPPLDVTFEGEPEVEFQGRHVAF
jgi:hypothetical protein